MLALARAPWESLTISLRKLFAQDKPRRSRRVLGVESLEQRDVPTAGLLDPTFGAAGKAVVPFDLAPTSLQDQAHDFVVQSDNKIVIVGSATNADGDFDFAVTRLNADGTLDKTFNKTGKQTFGFVKGAAEFATGVALQADGKIIVAGSVQSAGSNFDFGVARLNTDGTLDASFGQSAPGLETIAFDLVKNGQDIAHDVAVQADGKIVVAGSAVDPNNLNEFAATRLNTDGTLDKTFGTQGLFHSAVVANRDSIANSVALQADGGILLAGAAAASPTDTHFGIMRLNATGNLDLLFGSLGKAQVDFKGQSERANALAIQADGKILVAGESSPTGTNVDFAIARLNVDGSLDTLFNHGISGGFFKADNNGLLTIDFAGNADFANGVAVQPDGKILVGGEAGISGTVSNFGVARLKSDGTLDTAFGISGKATVAFKLSADTHEFADGVALQSDGQIILAGTIDTATANQDFAATRLTGDTVVTPPVTTPPTTSKSFDKLGAYRSTDGSFSLDSNGNRVFDAGVDTVVTGYAPSGVIPVAGNWDDNADGRTKLGYFSNGTWHLDVNGNGKDDAGDLTFKFGDAGDTPVVGKWDGVHTRVGVFTTRGSFTGFTLDTTGSHDFAAGESHVFGLAGDKVVVGDWTGDGKTKIGVFRPNGDGSGAALFSLDLNGNFNYDGPQEAFVYGLATDGFIVGDWNGDGKSKLGVYRSSPINPGVGYFTLDSNGDRQYEQGVDEVFHYGLASDHFIAGNWSASKATTTAAQDAAFQGDLSDLKML